MKNHPIALQSSLARSGRFAALLFTLAASTVRAADPVVYRQPYTSAEDTTWDSFTAPGATPATVYDHFALASAADVTAVQWQGTYINHDDLAANPAAPDVSSFVVSFYADNKGQPGAQLSIADLPVAACAETSLGTVGFNAFNDATTYQLSYRSYRATLPAPFTAAAGQTYWLSVVGNVGSATPVWSWYASTADGDTVCFQDYAGNRLTRPHSRAFALEGTPAAANAPAAVVAATTPTTELDGAPGVFTVTLSAPAAADVKIAYTLKGSAVNGTDYQLLKGTVKIKAGKTSKAISIVPLGTNGIPTSKKTVKLTLAPGAGYTVGSAAEAKVKINPGQVIVLP